MKVLSTGQIRQADDFTIINEPVQSIDLMERAANAFMNCFYGLSPHKQPITVICGMGNNGGDGLAIARKMFQNDLECSVFVLKYAQKGSKDYQINLKRLQEMMTINVVEDISELNINSASVVIDAILGTGLSRPLQGLVREVVGKMNNSGCKIFSVDVPTGLYVDKPNSSDDAIVRADKTITFQFPKLSFLLPQNGKYTGDWESVNIKLSEEFIKNAETKNYFTQEADITSLLKTRGKNSHKGTFGSALLVAGSYGMMGAAVMSARSCLRTGVGKLTVHTSPVGYDILQTAVPEAMFLPSADHDSGRIQSFFYAKDVEKYQAVGVGPGMGVDVNVKQSVSRLIEACREAKVPLVIDADGLNNIADSPLILARLPENTILTPHPGEFKTLIGKSWKDDFERLELLRNFAQKYRVIVCLKGANTSIALPNGDIHFNSTGNAGMATAGSGDVLTGMILSLLAQGYEPKDAAIVGVFQHGQAGDRAAHRRSQRSMIASDIVEAIE